MLNLHSVLPRTAALSGAVLILFVGAAQADSFQWSGSGVTDNWSNSFNWVDVRAPINSLDDTSVNFFAGSGRSNSDVNGDWQINSLNFNDIGGGTSGISQSFRVFSTDDKTLTIGSVGIINFSEAVQTIDVDIALAANQTWAAKGQDLVINGDRSGSAELSIFGDTPFRSVTITGNGAAFTGTIDVTSGTLRLGAGDTVNDDSEVNVDAGATFDLGGTEEEIGLLSGSGDMLIGAGRLILGSNTHSTEFSGRLLGTGTLTYASNQTSDFRGNNVLFRGLIEVLAGQLEITGSADTLGDDASAEVAAGAKLVIGGDGESFGALSGAGTLELNAGTTVGVNGRSTTFSGTITDGFLSGASFTKAGRGTLTLTGTNTFTGLLTVAGGTLQLGLGNTLRDSHVVQVDAGGRLLIDGDDETIGALSGAGEVDLKRSLVVTSNSVGSNFSGRMLGQGGLTKGGSSTFTLSGVNEFEGPLTVLNGTLEIAGNANTLANEHVVDVVNPSARLRIAGDGEDFGGLRGAGKVVLAANMGTGFNHQDSAFAGDISGTGGFTKGGRGTLTLRGNNDVNGALTVRDGKLSIAAGRTAFTGAQVRRDGTLDIVGGNFVTTGTLDVDGSLALRAGVLDVTTLALDPRASFTFAGGTLRATTIEGSVLNGGTLAPGHSPGRTTVFGDYAQALTGVLEIELASLGSFDVLAISGVAALNGQLEIKLVDGFAPTVGSVFEFLIAKGGIQGAFSVMAQPLLSGRLFQLDTSQPDRLSLRVVSAAGLEPVPLPPSAWLFGGALLALAGRRRARPLTAALTRARAAHLR